MDMNEKEKTPSFKEMIVGYADQKTRPIIRLFNGLYLAVTLLAYLYYLVYVVIHVVKNGIDNPISILLVIAVSIYTVILVACALASSSFKTAKKRIKKNLKWFKILKRSITIGSSIVAIIALVATFKSEDPSAWTIVVSIFSLIMNIIKISFALFMITLSAGTSALKFGTKQAYRYAKKKYSLKKTAPEQLPDAADDQTKIEN